MAGIPKYTHQIEVKGQHEANMFFRFHSEAKRENVEVSGSNLLVTFSTKTPIAEKDQTTILTFAGRPSDGNGYVNFNE